MWNFTAGIERASPAAEADDALVLGLAGYIDAPDQRCCRVATSRRATASPMRSLSINLAIQLSIAVRVTRKAGQPFLGRTEQAAVMIELAVLDPSRTLAPIPTLGQNDLCSVGFARPVQRMWKFDICLRHDWSVPP
jgi:hypothetical protein